MMKMLIIERVIKMCQLTRMQKHNIRKRDAKRIKLTGVCSLCHAKDVKTSRHHLWYNADRFCKEAVIEVCDTCDCKIHKRDENDNWVRTLKSVRSIELVRNEEYTDRYDIIVEDQNVGCAHPTLTGLKLIIMD